MEATQDQVFTGGELSAQINEVENIQDSVGVDPSVTADGSIGQIDDATLLVNLEQRLKDGKFVVRGLSPNSVRYLNNFIREKAQYKSPQDAYYLLILGMDIATIVNNDNAKNPSKKDLDVVQDYEMRAFTIKVANYFLSRIEGQGLKNAQPYFATAQPINNAILDIQVVEKQVEALRKKLGIESEAEAQV